VKTDVLVKILAIVGGGVGGGLGLGLLAQLLMRAATIRNPPRWSLLTVRLLGCVICGWLVALWLFGGGGSGIGGSGGLGLGTGAGKGEGQKAAEIDKKNKGTAEAAGEQTLRIEVLGRDALSESDIRAERWYRIETAQGPRLLTFAQIKEAVEKRQHEQPELRRIEIVLYKDSPDERVLIVSQLRTWAGDRKDGKMKVDISRPDSDAPRK
jgi:hypothetical protein